MHRKRFALLACLGLMTAELPAQNRRTLAEKDLALALPLTMRELPAAPHLPKAWFQEIDEAFRKTSVGPALESESPYRDWQLVALRIAPCAPLGFTTATAAEDCWPEIRLVWQPVQRKIRLHEIYMEAAADDRAVHAIYPLAPARFLGPELAARTQSSIATLSQGHSLDSKAREEFRKARDQVLTTFLPMVHGLRDSSLPASSFAGFGIRPETEEPALLRAFAERLNRFLKDLTPPAGLGTLTAFSLPEGREPAHLDEWIFLAFRLQQGRLVPDPILIRSARDGHVLATLGSSMRGTQARDDDSLYELLNGSTDAEELTATVMLWRDDISRLTPLVQDRERVLVPNTSCVSCHKMNDLRFDFHNFSYLEDREITISPRVKRDVALDLRWLQQLGF